MSVKSENLQVVDSSAQLHLTSYLLSDPECFSRHSAQSLQQLTSLLPPRFLVKIAFRADGCWFWIGSSGFHPKYRQHRYGQFVIMQPKRKMTSAHRFAYEATFGPIAKELDVDHLCQNKLCVNPEHLRAITHRENCQNRKRVAK